MFLVTLALAGSLVSPGFGAQTLASQTPLEQFASDLEGAIARGHLTEVQRTQLHADQDVLRSAIQAKRSGGEVDRRSIISAVKDVRKVAHTGAFQADDQRKLETDLEALRNR